MKRKLRERAQRLAADLLLLPALVALAVRLIPPAVSAGVAAGRPGSRENETEEGKA